VSRRRQKEKGKGQKKEAAQAVPDPQGRQVCHSRESGNPDSFTADIAEGRAGF
jgi:hypothetical protein